MNAASQVSTSTSFVDGRIPVTLLTGFLGAGKTTLLNHLVSHPDMAGTALLINEFGEVGIDHHLVDTVDETLLVLDSGCICCSVQGDLVKALKNLAQRSSKREIPPVTRVVIETTGLADPVPVVYTLMQEPFVAARYRCDGVVTAVDATHALTQIEQHVEALRQVVMADRLLITKCDLADDATLAGLRARLQELNAGAVQVQVWEGRTAPESLFCCGLYTPEGKASDVAVWLGEEHKAALHTLQKSAGIAWNKGKGHVASPTRHHDGSVTSFVVRFPSPVSWRSFAVAMGQVLERHGPQLLRIKGLMNVVGDSRPRVIHCVQNVAYPPINLAKWPVQSLFEDRRGRLVFIVRNLTSEDIDGIKAAFAECDREPTPVLLGGPICPPATICWMTHNMAAAKPLMDLEGWQVQAKRLGRR